MYWDTCTPIARSNVETTYSRKSQVCEVTAPIAQIKVLETWKGVYILLRGELRVCR